MNIAFSRWMTLVAAIALPCSVLADVTYIHAGKLVGFLEGQVKAEQVITNVDFVMKGGTVYKE